MNKKMSLGTAMIIRTIPIIFFPIFYYTMVRTHYTTFDSFIPVIVGTICGGLFSLYHKMKKDINDELAKRNKLKSDSICFTVAIITLIFIMITIGFSNISTITIGYIISFDIVFLAILNVIIFNIIDKKGV
ncbi:hypothetical protein K9O30_09905 [Clostridium bowmanii]|uniref:hypothetical protein n=1 Tax=Clostridium bowmanii TaxID=132925 RepID=UPI001C0E2EF6|nr:hypothetical protein [Clostridium bowmanii]MBU3189413.1 hypothetical protein [Clostridium bowmanii]MCA1074027.1 hypothetical protein [Clostridium bowmanii]